MLPFLQRGSDDWKSSLDREDERELNKMLKKLEKYRHSYTKSENVKNAQLWTAILEMQKEKEEIDKRLRRMEYVFGGMIERVRKQINDQDAELERKEKDLESLLKSLDKF